MKYIFPYIKKPKNRALLAQLDGAALRLEKKLLHADIDNLQVSDYNKKYLRKYVVKSRQTFQKYVYILLNALDGIDKPPDRVVLIDFGGGSGLLSLLAKEAGVGKVLYNDIFETSCDDVRLLAKTFELGIDDYICGDIPEIRQYLGLHRVKLDVLVSSDVLEHVYDLESFYSSVYQLSSDSLNVVMSTHANPWNPVINRTLMKQQRRVELTDRIAEWGHKERDSLKSYLKIRYEMIRKNFPQLTETAAHELAENTRGQKEDDILKTVNDYMRNNVQPISPKHPTNTCDPTNGNWADRLVAPPVYRTILNKTGFEAQLRSGFYGHPKPVIRRTIARLLDLGIVLLGPQGPRLSSYFLVIGKK